MSDPLAQFEADWLVRLQQGAEAAFHYGEVPKDAGFHSAVADDFVGGLGYKRIGFNWELLDASASPSEPRSALGEITEAVAFDISNPSREWLGEDKARHCARQLLGAYSADRLTVVSNRYDGLWNPISGASVEWGFVCFDDTRIALLLIRQP